MTRTPRYLKFTLLVIAVLFTSCLRMHSQGDVIDYEYDSQSGVEYFTELAIDDSNSLDAYSEADAPFETETDYFIVGMAQDVFEDGSLISDYQASGQGYASDDFGANADPGHSYLAVGTASYCEDGNDEDEDDECDQPYLVLIGYTFASVECIAQSPYIDSSDPASANEGDQNLTMTLYGENLGPGLNPQLSYSTGGMEFTVVSADEDGVTVKYSVDDDAVIGENYISAQTAGGISNDFLFPIGPKIVFTNQTAAITNTTQTVQMGQQISLATAYSLQDGVHVSDDGKSWSIDGDSVGNFTASLSGSDKTDVVTDDDDTSFYFTSAGTRNVTFYLSLDSGDNVSATVQFIVEGPTISVNVDVGTITTANQKLQFGDGSMSNVGITGTATITRPADYSIGTLSWVQLITNSSVVYRGSTGPSQTCIYGPGEDSSHPYTVGTTLTDNPGIALDPADASTTASDLFKTYLMWTPDGTTPSIPVPIGYIDWGWSATASPAATPTGYATTAQNIIQTSYLCSQRRVS